MREHLQHDAVEGGGFFRGPRDRIAGELYRGKNSQQAVADMVDGGVSHHPFQIALSQRRRRRKDNRDNCQAEQGSLHGAHLGREERQKNSQESIDAHFGHGPGQQHGSAGGRFSVGGGQPGVKGHERRFDGEPQENAKENDRSQRFFGRKECPAQFGKQGRVKTAFLGQARQLGEVKKSCRGVDGQEGQQHGHAAGQRVNAELVRGPCALGAAPHFDQEKRGDQSQLPINKPVKEIQGGKCAEQARFQEQNQGKIEFRVLLDFPGSQHGKRNDQGREHHHQKSQSVDAEMIIDTERRHPIHVLAELVACFARIERRPYQHGAGQGKQAGDKGNEAGKF